MLKFKSYKIKIEDFNGLKLPLTVSQGNVIDILLLSQRKETHVNIERKMGLAYLLNQPNTSSQINTCFVMSR